MHELSICNALVAQVESIAAEHGATSVSRIVLQIGPLSGVEADLLRNAYPLAVAGTIAESAELELERSDVTVACSICGEETKARPNRLLCGTCGDFRTRVVSGDEMILRRVELGGTRADPENPAGRPATDRARMPRYA